jgi:hypothetical protein
LREADKADIDTNAQIEIALETEKYADNSWGITLNDDNEMIHIDRILDLPLTQFRKLNLTPEEVKRTDKANHWAECKFIEILV